jgi:enolase
MDQYIPVTDIIAREILDSRGNPTVEVEGGDSRAGRPYGACPGAVRGIDRKI